jgi:hypothetical protein
LKQTRVSRPDDTSLFITGNIRSFTHFLYAFLPPAAVERNHCQASVPEVFTVDASVASAASTERASGGGAGCESGAALAFAILKKGLYKSETL